MAGLKFHVADEGAVGNGMVYIAAEQYDFGAAINAAMLEAMQAQCQEGGTAFADYAGWLSQGIADAEMGQEETVRAMATENRGSYHVDHRSYTDHDFMNLITGGFYDYADFQMAVCTSSMDGIEYTYYLAGLGDELVACVQEMSEPNENGQLDDEMIAELNEFYIQSAEPVKGYYMGVTSEGSRVVTHVGIDFQTADQKTLVDSGMVSGKFKGNTTTSYLSFSSTINGFQEDGMTCVVTPVYQAAK